MGTCFSPEYLSLILMFHTWHLHVAVTSTNGRILATFEKAPWKIREPGVKERMCTFLLSVKGEQHDLCNECDGLTNVPSKYTVEAAYYNCG
jgi:hypothetical protein